jgi:hypothetical protein
MGFHKGKPERKPRNATKLNRAMALEQAKRGMSNVEIAQLQNVNHSTVFRFMQRMKPERQALEHFKTHRADVLARLQAKSLDAQERILDSLNDGVIQALTASQKSSFLMSLNAQHGTSFDKERLERGQSTSNQSIISRMLDNTVKDLYRPKPLGREDRAAEK